MASSRASSCSLALAAVVLLLFAGPGLAQSSSAPAPSSPGNGSCLTEIVSLYPCLGYMSGNGSSTKPSASCCSALSSVVSSNPRCLCSVLGGGAASLGVTVNTTRALQLPAACSVKTPPPSQCKSAGVPVPSTSSSPATTPSTATPASPATTASVPAAPSGAAGTGTTTKATQTAESSGGSTTGGKATSVLSVAVVVLSAAVALLHA